MGNSASSLKEPASAQDFENMIGKTCELTILPYSEGALNDSVYDYPLFQIRCLSSNNLSQWDYCISFTVQENVPGNTPFTFYSKSLELPLQIGVGVVDEIRNMMVVVEDISLETSVLKNSGSWSLFESSKIPTFKINTFRCVLVEEMYDSDGKTFLESGSVIELIDSPISLSRQGETGNHYPFKCYPKTQ